MHLGFFIWALQQAGGIQRSGSALANAMAERGHEVSIFYTEQEADAPLWYPLHPSIRLRPLGIAENTLDIDAAKIQIMNANLSVLIAPFSWDGLLHLPALLWGTGIPLLISERNNPKIIAGERWHTYEHNACLAAADGIHVLLPEFVSDYPKFLQSRITVIPNFIEPSLTASATGNTDGKLKTILAAGRFVDSHKQFSLLLKAFAMLAPDLSDWRLVLCGDGQDADDYRSLIVDLGIADHTELPGMVSDMDSQYSAAHIFCIPSRYEGFCNVILEAQRHSLPVVGFAACSGVNDIIIDGESGLLAAEMTPASLAAALGRLMAEAETRTRLGRRGRELLSRFEKKATVDRWEKLILEVSARKGQTKLQELADSNYEEQQTLTALSEILARTHPFHRPHTVDLNKFWLKLLKKNLEYSSIISKEQRSLQYKQRILRQEQEALKAALDALRNDKNSTDG
jgi:glycosyltransferase involved in cell wall biosynthesis